MRSHSQAPRVWVCLFFLWLARSSVAGPQAQERPVEAPPAQADSALIERARSLVKKGEASEIQGGLSELGEELQTMASQLAAHREAHPDDAQAWILSARLGRLIRIAEPQVTRGGHFEEDMAAHEAEGAKRLAELQGFLDRVLNLDETNAEAHYWKARLYGVRRMVVRNDLTAYEMWDLRAAIREAGEALRLAPEVLAYREALAAYLVADQQDAAAAELMRAVSDGRHPYYLLLRQLAEIPVPPGAIATPATAENMAQTEAEKGRVQNFPLLRVRAYTVAASAAEIESFYRAKWPTFRLFGNGREKVEGARIELKMCLLLWSSNGLEPYKSKREVERIEVGSPEIGNTALVSVVEIRNLPAKLLASTEGADQLPADARKLFSRVVIANYRKLD